MARSGVNSGFAKCFILFMSITILLQGCVYLVLTIWGHTMGKCSQNPTNIKEQPIRFVMDLIYFAGKECGNPSVKISDVVGEIGGVGVGSRLDDTQELEIDWSRASIIKDRVHVLLIGYAVISVLWIATSLLMMVSICCVVTKLVNAVCYWPWFLSVMVGSVLDVIATGFFIKDMANTTSTEETLDYIGVIIDDSNSFLIDYLKKFSAYFVTPAIVMACISSRLVLVWLLNIFGAIFCFSTTTVVVSAKNKSEGEVIKPKHRTPVDDVIVMPRSPKASPYHLNWVQQQQQQEKISSPEQIFPKPLLLPRPAIQNEIMSNSDASSPHQSPINSLDNTRTNKQASPPTSKSISFSKRISDLKSKSNDNESSTYRSCDLHPEKLDYPSPNRTFSYVEPSFSRSTSPTSPTSQTSPTSPTSNNRYSSTDGLMHHQSHITEELRSQLPWSYTNLFMDPEVQRKIKSHLPQDEGEEKEETLPHIPDPDYTLHYPKKDRPQIGDRSSHW